MNRVLRLASWLSVVLALVSANLTSGYAQTAERLSQVKKIYVDSLGTDNGAAKMRERMVQRLRKSHEVQVVADPKEADALIRGTGRVWVTGQTSLSPHSHSANEPTFEGFLSVEVVGKDGGTLWSYLVSPSNFPWSNISDDLARQLVSKLLAALKGESPSEAAAAGSQAQIEGAKPEGVKTEGAKIEGVLKGAGATFPAPLYQRWFELFQEQHPDVHISYDAVGSAEGIRRLQEGRADFAASEVPVPDQGNAEAHQRFVHLPTVVGAVVVIYRVKGLHQTLNFTPEVLSGIFLGTIHKWNDPRIREANHGAALPDADIVVVHRSEGSGTTFVWTDYLSKISPQWKASVGVGATVTWPVGIGAEGNEGVASAVQGTPNSIAYVEFIYAIQHQLSFGVVRNAAGEFVKANLSTVTAAAAATADTQGRDFRVSITNPPGQAVYPIATYTWLLLPENEDKKKQVVVNELLRWVLTSGQKKCSALGYAPLPVEVAKRALESIDATK